RLSVCISMSREGKIFAFSTGGRWISQFLILGHRIGAKKTMKSRAFLKMVMWFSSAPLSCTMMPLDLVKELIKIKKVNRFIVLISLRCDTEAMVTYTKSLAFSFFSSVERLSM